MGYAGFEVTFGGAGLVVGGESFASFEVVADEFGDGGIDGCEVEDLAGEFVVVDGVKGFGNRRTPRQRSITSPLQTLHIRAACSPFKCQPLHIRQQHEHLCVPPKLPHSGN